MRAPAKQRAATPHDVAAQPDEENDQSRAHDASRRGPGPASSPARHPAAAATSRPVPAGSRGTAITASTAATTTVARPARRRRWGATSDTRHSGAMTSSAARSSRPRPNVGADADHRAPHGPQPEADGEEEASFVARRAHGPVVGERPRGVDDQGGREQPEPAGLGAPAASQRGRVDGHPGVDQQAGEDRHDRARGVDEAQGGQLGAAAVDEPAAGPADDAPVVGGQGGADDQGERAVSDRQGDEGSHAIAHRRRRRRGLDGRGGHGHAVTVPGRPSPGLPPREAGRKGGGRPGRHRRVVTPTPTRSTTVTMTDTTTRRSATASTPPPSSPRSTP